MKEGKVRTFSSGATRDNDENKLDYEAFFSAIVMERYARYMHEHRKQSDGTRRPGDNWQLGIPRKQYLKSLWRHFMDVFLIMRGYARLAIAKNLDEALCGVLFNVNGLLHEVLIGRDAGKQPE